MRAPELGYDRVFEGDPMPLRKPLSQVRREEIESAITAGVTVEALMNAYGAGTMDAYLSDASTLFPGDEPPKQPAGDVYDAA